MRIVVLVLIALLITTLSFGEDRLDRVPAMSAQIEVMDQLGLVELDTAAPHVHMQKAPVDQKPAPERIRIHRLADIMMSGD